MRSGEMYVSSIQVALVTEGTESLPPSLDGGLLEVLGPLGAAGATVEIRAREQPVGIAGSFLPEVQMIIAAVPWAAVAASTAAIVNSVTRLAAEWLHANAARTVRVTCPDGRSIELTGVHVDLEEIKRLFDHCAERSD
jgi:hypothetical protein